MMILEPQRIVEVKYDVVHDMVCLEHFMNATLQPSSIVNGVLGTLFG